MRHLLLIFIGLVLLMGLVTGCSPMQPVPVRFHITETGDPSSNPLTSYTSGALREIMVNGQLLQGGSYCDVRNAKPPPQEWHKAFDMKEYIWFELLFTGK